jgi:hypothetical protein
MIENKLIQIIVIPTQKELDIFVCRKFNGKRLFPFL